jgi:hypothetical protein
MTLLVTPAMSVLTSASQVIVYGLALLVVAGVMGVFMLWARRRLVSRAAGQDRPPEAGFTVERLEEMFRSGQISGEEFERLRRFALGLERRAGKSDGMSSSTPAGLDDGEVEGSGPGHA